MNPRKSQQEYHTLVEQMASQFAIGAHRAIEMMGEERGLAFDEWANNLNASREFSGSGADNLRLIWIWDSIRNDPILKERFQELASTNSFWNRNSKQILVIKAGEWFVIGLNKSSAGGLCFKKDRDPWEEIVSSQIKEDLYMRPGKGDRLECCDCQCDVFIRVDQVYDIDREADIMRIEAKRITIRKDEQMVQVRVDSLNQAYTVSSCRLEPNRRSHGGRIYDHVIHDGKNGRRLLEDVREMVEQRKWDFPTYINPHDADGRSFDS